MNATISRQPLILFLKVACNTVTYLRSKKIGWMINKWQFCAAKLAESVNYASSAFSEILEIMLVMTNYAKNYASTTYPSLISNERLTKKCLCNRASNNAGLKITAGQRTMSDLIVGLTGQTLFCPVILTGHFWMLVASCVLLYNAVIRCFLWLFLLLCTKPFKEKRSALLWSVMRPSLGKHTLTIIRYFLEN